MLRFCAVPFCNCFNYCAMCMQSTFDIIMKIPQGPDIILPPSILNPRKHCSRSGRIDAYGGRLTWRPIFGTLLTKIHTFNTILFYQKIKLKTCSYINVVSWIRVESNAISKMVVISAELLLLDHVANSTN